MVIPTDPSLNPAKDPGRAFVGEGVAANHLQRKNGELAGDALSL